MCASEDVQKYRDAELLSHLGWCLHCQLREEDSWDWLQWDAQ